MPNFEVLPCNEDDIPRFVEIISEAFSNDHEYVDAVFYNHKTAEGRKNAADMMLARYRHDPNGHYIKVVDTDTSEIIGAAKWNIYKAGEVPPAPQLSGPYWPNEEEEEFAKAIFDGFFAPRQKVLQENNGRLVGKSRLFYLYLHCAIFWPFLTGKSARNAHSRPSLSWSGCRKTTRQVGLGTCRSTRCGGK
jgi:hypothetical protein